MIPSLPIELVQLIIQLNLDQFNLSNFRERYNSLLQYSLVSRNWRNVAQELLLRHVVLETASSVNLFVEKMKEHGSLGSRITKSLAFLLETMVLRQTHYMNVSLILSKCENVEEIWFERMESQKLFSGILNWSKLTKLQSLHLIKCYALLFIEETSFDQLFFPALSHLSIINVELEYLPSLADILLRQLNLPLLTSLTLISIIEGHANNSHTLEIPSTLARQIKKLMLYDNYGQLETQLVGSLPDYESLESLVLRDISLLNNMQLIVPPSLLSLHLFRRLCDYTDDLETIDLWISNSEIVVKRISYLYRHDLICTEEDLESAARLVSTAKSRDIDLNLYLSPEPQDKLLNSDYIESDWKLLMKALDQIS